MAASSNIHEVIAWLEGWVDGIDFTRTGKDQSLGRDVAREVAHQISERSAIELRGAGATWPPNSTTPSRWHPEGYSAWKQKHYGWSMPNFRTGQMLSKASLFGRTQVAAHEVTMIYGTGAPPAHGGSPAGLISAQDEKVTDSEKAAFAHSGQSKARILRPFYELDDTIRQAVVEDVVQPWCNAYITDTNAANGV